MSWIKSSALAMVAVVCLGAAAVEDTQMVLARAAVAECGWVRADCHAAVWHTIKNRADVMTKGRRSLVYVARTYCTALKGRARTLRSRWVRELGGDGMPLHWEHPATWPKRQKSFARIHERAGKFLRGEVPNRCRSLTFEFGNRDDIAGRPNMRWKEIDCGSTGRQHFGRWVAKGRGR